MRAFGFAEHGGPERLTYLDVPEPHPGPGEVRVRLHSAAFNRLDRFTLAGMPGVPIERPHVSGSDGSGTVDALGVGVDDLHMGDRVLLNPGLWDGTCDACLKGVECLCRAFRIVGEHTQGTAAEAVVVPRRNVHPVPERLTMEEAAAVPLVFQTAWRAIRTIGAVQAGDRVAVIGGGGGVVPAVVQVAAQAGADVAVVARNPSVAEANRRLGASVILPLDEGHPLDRALWEWSGKRGVDLVFDSVGAPTLPRSVRAVARGGRVVVIGATAGPVVELDVRTLFWRQASIRGSTMATAKEFREVLSALARGDLKPVVDRVFPWTEAPSAFARMESPDLFGKVVLRAPP